MKPWFASLALLAVAGGLAGCASTEVISPDVVQSQHQKHRVDRFMVQTGDISVGCEKYSEYGQPVGDAERALCDSHAHDFVTLLDKAISQGGSLPLPGGASGAGRPAMTIVVEPRQIWHFYDGTGMHEVVLWIGAMEKPAGADADKRKGRLLWSEILRDTEGAMGASHSIDERANALAQRLRDKLATDLAAAGLI